MIENLAQIAASELREDGLSEQEIQLIIVRRFHGYLCCGLSHLFAAVALYGEHEPAICATITKHAKALAEIVPSYGEFDSSTRKPSKQR